MRGGYLLDTNHLGQAVTPRSPTNDKIVELRSKGVKVGTCIPVLCEIEVGVKLVRSPDQYHKNLDSLLRQVRIWPIDRTTARFYGEIYHDLRRRGRALSQIDMMLAALARQLNVTLVTTDNDFDAMPDLRRENWLK